MEAGKAWTRACAVAVTLVACTAPVETLNGELQGESELPPRDTSPESAPTRPGARSPQGRGPNGGGDGGTPVGRPSGGGKDAGAAPLDAGTGMDAAPAGTPDFVDAFDRADAPAVGNAWFEKTPNIFGIQGGAVVQRASAQPYWNTFVARPLGEAVLDVELSADITYPATFANTGHEEDLPDPALYARIQPESSQPNNFSCYSFYAYPDLAGITREVREDSEFLSTGPISPPLQPGQKVHFVFRVTGTNPVALEGIITTPEGTALKTISTTDTDASRIVQGGSFGFGSDVGPGLVLDAFRRVQLE